MTVLPRSTTCTDVTKAYGSGGARGRRRRPARPARSRRRVRRRRRAVRLRQVDAAAAARRARPPDRGRRAASRAATSPALGDGELAALRRETLGFVFQQFNLIPTLTAHAERRGRARAGGLRVAERRSARGASCSTASGSPARAGHLPIQLSGGEQQRVAIARALANLPARAARRRADRQPRQRHAGTRSSALLHGAERRGGPLGRADHPRPRDRRRGPARGAARATGAPIAQRTLGRMPSVPGRSTTSRRVRDGARAGAARSTRYEVRLAADGREALDRLAERSRVDAIVLDVAMPGIDGLEVCRRLRAAGDRTPVLMLTARDAVDDRVAGLDAGRRRLPRQAVRAGASSRRGCARCCGGAEPAGGGAALRRPRARPGRPRGAPRRPPDRAVAHRVRPARAVPRAPAPGAHAARQIFERVWGYDFGATLQRARRLRRLPAAQDGGRRRAAAAAHGARGRLRAAGGLRWTLAAPARADHDARGRRRSWCSRRVGRLPRRCAASCAARSTTQLTQPGARWCGRFGGRTRAQLRREPRRAAALGRAARARAAAPGRHGAATSSSLDRAGGCGRPPRPAGALPVDASGDRRAGRRGRRRRVRC